MKGKKTGGRTAGTPNKVTATLKEMVESALTDSGGVEYLKRQAQENPTAFLTLLGKILPKNVEVTGEVRHTLESLVLSSLRSKDK